MSGHITMNEQNSLAFQGLIPSHSKYIIELRDAHDQVKINDIRMAGLANDLKVLSNCMVHDWASLTAIWEELNVAAGFTLKPAKMTVENMSNRRVSSDTFRQSRKRVS